MILIKVSILIQQNSCKIKETNIIIFFCLAKIIIAQYLKKEYRPYGVTDLVLNLHNMINKSLMVKALDEMVDDKILIVKKYGKLSFYCYSEQKFDENIKPIQIETLLELKDEVKQLENDYNEIQKGGSFKKQFQKT